MNFTPGLLTHQQILSCYQCLGETPRQLGFVVSLAPSTIIVNYLLYLVLLHLPILGTCPLQSQIISNCQIYLFCFHFQTACSHLGSPLWNSPHFAYTGTNLSRPSPPIPVICSSMTSFINSPLTFFQWFLTTTVRHTDSNTHERQVMLCILLTE